MSGRYLAIAVALLALATLPYWMPGTYYVNIASQIMFYAVFALAIDILIGYGGLVSLGHAGLFGVSCYGLAVVLAAGWGHLAAIVVALVMTMATTAVFAVVSLRASGVGFLMITLALGQILWGLAYRWISVTNGDNGITVDTRPFGQALTSATGFYYAALTIFLVSLLLVVTFVNSPFGAALTGTRDQPRRMNALGYNVWLIRFMACLFSGLLTGVAGILFVYYNQFISPQTLALTASAEVVLMVISGGTATLFGPIVGAALVVIMKNVASAYIVRWNFLLGAIFVAIVIFMPDGLVPGTARLLRWARDRMSGRSKPSGSGKDGRR
jgi:branched-chain amino acid transport system permease protein